LSEQDEANSLFEEPTEGAGQLEPTPSTEGAGSNKGASTEGAGQWAHGPLGQDPITDAQHGINALGKTFVGARPPMWDLEHEQVWHRAAALAFASGASAKCVATQLGKSQPAVLNLLRQDWFQEKVTAILAEFREERDIMRLLVAEQARSLVTMIEVRDDPTKPCAVRVACAKDILDRTLGKPTQRVEVSQETTSDDPVNEYAKLEEENARLRQQSERL
jgi:hypothetical protein